MLDAAIFLGRTCRHFHFYVLIDNCSTLLPIVKSAKTLVRKIDIFYFSLRQLIRIRQKHNLRPARLIYRRVQSTMLSPSPPE